MQWWQVPILSVIQGAAELLPVSSSAHVIVAEKLMGLDPTSPEMTLLLVTLHTGTMFAVIAYFWSSWRKAYFSSLPAFLTTALNVGVATALTGVIGLALQWIIKHLFAANAAGFEIEQLFGNAKLMAGALAAAGVLIIISARMPQGHKANISLSVAAMMGAVQGLCLPFRGFSRSGATISTGLALGTARRQAEEFSFALAVALTPVVVLMEVYRLYKAQGAVWAAHPKVLIQMATPDLVGMVLSFAAGLLALRWLSSWLEKGRWQYFGIYCLAAAAVVLAVG